VRFFDEVMTVRNRMDSSIALSATTDGLENSHRKSRLTAIFECLSSSVTSILRQAADKHALEGPFHEDDVIDNRVLA
jgi:hypothetical protein